MKVEGLTNDEVKSHLQKYRLHTRRAPNGSGATGNQPMVVMGGLWFQDNQYGTSKSQSESPQGPLQLARIIIPPKGVKTSWIMHEYRLADNNTSMKPPPVAADMGSKKGSLRPDEWVLCRIYKKNNSQRPEKEDSMDDMNSTIGMQNHRTMNSGALLDNAENLFDDLLDQDGMNGNSMSSQLAYSSSKPFNMVSSSRSGVYSLKRALPTPYWSEPNGSAKRFNANQQSMVMDGSSTITGLLNQFPQSVQYNQQALLGSIDDNVFGSPYPGMNWNSQ